MTPLISKRGRETVHFSWITRNKPHGSLVIESVNKNILKYKIFEFSICFQINQLIIFSNSYCLYIFQHF